VTELEGPRYQTRNLEPRSLSTKTGEETPAFRRMPAGPRLDRGADRAIGLVNSPQRGADRSDLSERPRDEEWTEALTDAIQPL
jgi:hypothetical protein